MGSGPLAQPLFYQYKHTNIAGKTAVLQLIWRAVSDPWPQQISKKKGQ